MVKKAFIIIFIMFCIVVLPSCRATINIQEETSSGIIQTTEIKQIIVLAQNVEGVQLSTSGNAIETTFNDTTNITETTEAEQSDSGLNLGNIDLREIIKTIIVSGIIINILGAIVTCIIIFFKINKKFKLHT